MKKSPFRLFCLHKWNEHRDEIFLWTKKPASYDDKYYFNKHRWLLKVMYKQEKNSIDE